MGPYQILQIQAKVDLGVMIMKGYSTLSKVPVSSNQLKPQMQFSVIPGILDGKGLPLYRCVVDVTLSSSGYQTNNLYQ